MGHNAGRQRGLCVVIRLGSLIVFVGSKAGQSVVERRGPIIFCKFHILVHIHAIILGSLRLRLGSFRGALLALRHILKIHRDLRSLVCDATVNQGKCVGLG